MQFVRFSSLVFLSKYFMFLKFCSQKNKLSVFFFMHIFVNTCIYKEKEVSVYSLCTPFHM